MAPVNVIAVAEGFYQLEPGPEMDECLPTPRSEWCAEGDIHAVVLVPGTRTTVCGLPRKKFVESPEPEPFADGPHFCTQCVTVLQCEGQTPPAASSLRPTPSPS